MRRKAGELGRNRDVSNRLIVNRRCGDIINDLIIAKALFSVSRA